MNQAMPIGQWAAQQRAGKGKRRENPETPVTREVRGIFRMCQVPHFKHWGGPYSAKGVSDLIGTVPAGPQKGRAIYCEIKVPGKGPDANQIAFLAEHEAAGALCFVAVRAADAVRHLAAAGVPEAIRLQKMMPKETTL